ncbi:MmpS family transport accessory protein [Umezawaea sp. Da 62-37]|uniref:MmpS family transport accessory protein n=1 Tax=Umezawaea sp. Da 62-37 TaxID=3075927 RepID=UPI0028F744FB|nr:MmpS family transport accessory protein [Umezawaea sp. Da 62-37]WNV90633.1 MmpS family transport accessory protein [Umezawaea sp. Da 62-37]
MTYPQQPQPPQQPPAYYAPMPPAPKKTKKWPWVVGIIVALVVIGSVANGGKTPTTPAASTPGASTPAAPVATVAPVENAAPAAKVRTVVYEVTGTGTAGNITYTTDGMTSTEQVSDVPLPWSKTIELPTNEALQIVQVLAQNGGDGEISATITVDGKVVKTGKSTGAYAVVSVNESIGTLGR